MVLQLEESLTTLQVGPLEVNCYVLWDPEKRSAFIIDPGGDADRIERAVRSKGLEVRYIVNTHGHFDHVGADGEVKSALGGLVAIHRKDARLLGEAPERGEAFGV